MKKIQISTVRQEANVEVIYVNAALISKVVKAHIAATKVIEDAKECGTIIEPIAPVVDANGNTVDERATDKNGKPITEYYCADDALIALNETIAPLLSELVNAFEE
jgi:hypothetical protein